IPRNKTGMCDFFALPRNHWRQLCPTDTPSEVVSCLERAQGTTPLCSGNLHASFFKRHGLFLKEGYENFTTRKLAAKAGLSQTGLYVYFKTKDQLLDAVCRSTFAGLVERFREVSANSGDAPDLLRRLLVS